MSITVSSSTKHLLARFGPNKLFGDNVDERKLIGETEGIALFESVWRNKLEKEILSAEKCSPQDAFERLTPSQQRYFDETQVHRSFRMQDLNAEFVVQLALSGGEDFQLTQFWRVSSSDTHPKTLFVTFETVEEREQFKTLAQNLNFGDEELGLLLVRDFMNKHPRKFLVGRIAK